jgi:hypothetical protein
VAIDVVLEKMQRDGIPMTRQNYLALAYLGDPPEEIGPEVEAQLPKQFQLNPPDEIDEIQERTR